MTFTEKITQFFEDLEAKDFRTYFITIISIFLLLIGFIMYRYYSVLRYEKKRMGSINKQREEVQDLLYRYERVKKQQADVDALLAKEPDFKIAGYFKTVMQEQGITDNLTREPETDPNVLENGYTEITLSANFSNLSIKTIAELLDTLEKNERIYTKYVEIFKPNATNTLSLGLQIATLEPKAEETE